MITCSFFSTILVYNLTASSMTTRWIKLKTVLTRLCQTSLTVNPEKLTLESNSTQLLDHVTSPNPYTDMDVTDFELPYPKKF